MFPFPKKVHPEERYLVAASEASLQKSSDSDSDSSLSDYEDPICFEEEHPSTSTSSSVYSAPKPNAPEPNAPKLNAPKSNAPKLNDAQRKAQHFWEEALEDFEILLEGNFGKSDLYVVEGLPLKSSANNASGVGLHLITDQVMKAYGLEFHGVIDGIFTDDFVTKGLMETIVPDLTRLNVKGSMYEKLIVWIKDDPAKLITDPKNSYCRILMSELLRRELEPHFLLASNDLDDEILSSQLEPLQTQKQISDKMDTDILNNIFLAALYLSLAAEQCKLIIVDCNETFLSEGKAHAFLTYVEHLKHKVYFLEASPMNGVTESDRRSQISKAVKHIEKWHKSLLPSSNAWKKAAYAGPELSINELMLPPSPFSNFTEHPTEEVHSLGESTSRDNSKPDTSKKDKPPGLDIKYLDDQNYISNRDNDFLSASRAAASPFPAEVEFDAKSAMETPL